MQKARCVAAPPKLSYEVGKNLGSSRSRWKLIFCGAFVGGVLISRVPAQVVGSGAECERERLCQGGLRAEDRGSGVPSGLVRGLRRRSTLR